MIERTIAQSVARIALVFAAKNAVKSGAIVVQNVGNFVIAMVKLGDWAMNEEYECSTRIFFIINEGGEDEGSICLPLKFIPKVGETIEFYPKEEDNLKGIYVVYKIEHTINYKSFSHYPNHDVLIYIKLK